MVKLLSLSVRLIKLISKQKYSKAKEVCSEIQKVLATYDKSC
jgi:hypothetical protein